jgi:hypothetical protein
MANYAVELRDHDRWAVFHSTSGTMYAPTFEERLAAEIFAQHFAGPHVDNSEAHQVNVGLQILTFLDEVAPKGSRKRAYARTLSLEWMKKLDHNWDNPNDEPEPGFPPTAPDYDVEQLTDDFGQGTQDARTNVDFVMDEFNAWRKRNLVAV